MPHHIAIILLDLETVESREDEPLTKLEATMRGSGGMEKKILWTFGVLALIVVVTSLIKRSKKHEKQNQSQDG